MKKKTENTRSTRPSDSKCFKSVFPLFLLFFFDQIEFYDNSQTHSEKKLNDELKSAKQLDYTALLVNVFFKYK